MVWVVCWLFDLISCGVFIGWCVWLVGLVCLGFALLSLFVDLVFRLQCCV